MGEEKVFKLSNGVTIPKLAFGTYQLPNNESGYDAIRYAIDAGYRHIDTAASYRNGHLIAKAIADSGLKREDFFITSKLWNIDHGYEEALKAFETSCNNIETSYLDLYLIHWPIAIGHEKDYQETNKATWKAFEKLYKEKRINAIGTCNFLTHHLIPLMNAAEIKPMVNQIEFNPYYQQRETVAYCQDANILVQAWAPLMRGKAIMQSELKKIAKKYNVPVSKLCLVYCLQKNILPIARSLAQNQIKENSQIFDLVINDSDMQYLDNLNTFTEYTFHPDRNEEWFE